MSSSKVNIDKMSLEIIKQLDLYGEEAREVVDEAVTKTAKETVKEIRSRALSQFNGSGKYAKSWRYKRDTSLRGKWFCSMVVYANENGYRLAHLLEHGHANVNGGRTDGREHISPAEEIAEKNLVEYIKEGMNKI